MARQRSRNCACPRSPVIRLGHAPASRFLGSDLMVATTKVSALGRARPDERLERVVIDSRSRGEGVGELGDELIEGQTST